MHKYLFKTTTTMKEYNYQKYWIDRDIVGEKTINADTLAEALNLYRERVADNDYIVISKTAITKKKPMFVDTPNGPMQVGYVITGSTEIDHDKHYTTTQYVDLWVKIYEIKSVFPVSMED